MIKKVAAFFMCFVLITSLYAGKAGKAEDSDEYDIDLMQEITPQMAMQHAWQIIDERLASGDVILLNALHEAQIVTFTFWQSKKQEKNFIKWGLNLLFLDAFNFFLKNIIEAFKVSIIPLQDPLLTEQVRQMLYTQKILKVVTTFAFFLKKELGISFETQQTFCFPLKVQGGTNPFFQMYIDLLPFLINQKQEKVVS